MNAAVPALPPQLSFRAVVLSIVLAVVLAAANAYLGLFAGLTIASAIPAAVVSMGVLRALGGGHILENNIVQTGASAGCSIATGVIFTVPALVLLGYWQDFQYGWVLAIAGLGGLLGVLFSVPLRRSLIVDQGMPFPEGKAAAEVLRTGENPGAGIKVLAIAAALGGFAKLAGASGLRLIPDAAAVATKVGKSIFYVGTNLSPALFGVGYIVGLNVGIVIVAGGIISWDIALPIYSAWFLPDNPALAATVAGQSPVDAAYSIWGAELRYLGVGAMLVGGLWTLFSLRNSLLSGIRQGLASARAARGGETLPHTEQDIPMKAILIGLLLFTLPLAYLYYSIVGSWGIATSMTVIMVVTGFLFCSVSAYMAGLVGSSNNPVSGMTICTILFAALVLVLLMGRDAPLGPMAAIMIGAVVCCAACIAGDNLQDLKAGYMVGATPWRQQVMLGIGALSCALMIAPVLQLLAKAYGIGTPTAEHPDPLIAPQATLIASVVKGIFGGQLPWTMVAIGAGIGGAIIVLDEILKARKSHFRTPVLAAAVGIYLPLDLNMAVFLGSLIAYFVERRTGMLGADEDAKQTLHRTGTLFSAGLITGEALMGILMAIPIVVMHKADVLALPEQFQFGQWLGIAVMVVVSAMLYRASVRSAQAGRG